ARAVTPRGRRTTPDGMPPPRESSPRIRVHWKQTPAAGVRRHAASDVALARLSIYEIELARGPHFIQTAHRQRVRRAAQLLGLFVRLAPDLRHRCDEGVQR